MAYQLMYMHVLVVPGCSTPMHTLFLLGTVCVFFKHKHMLLPAVIKNCCNESALSDQCLPAVV